jgi:CRISPR-associated endonuclease/helicase Cas3
MSQLEFAGDFEKLTGNPPFPWQSAMYLRFLEGDFPRSCSLPTGLGKTAVIPIWLLALANAPDKVPRRLVYVVNRRTVVDQSTTEARKMRDALGKVPGLTEQLQSLCADPTDIPLAISTLRGQFADNREWSADPARPAVIAGTVDMIGSRLLFSGYGCGFKSRPLHAGFLGQDVLLVHDEAHLEPAFQILLTEIRKEQERCGEFRQFRVMELTATSRGQEEQFRLTPTDNDEPRIQNRISAKKRVVLHELADEKKSAEGVIKLALAHKDSNQAILVFLRKLEDVEKVAAKLPRGQVERLTGTLRGRERDRLARANPIFARFLPASDRSVREVASGTVYLVCTSAGEVGVNISADHLVCDLTPFDSMAQRFGRVNRFGDGDARIDVVFPTEFSEEEYDLRRQRTLELLRRLNEDASPAALNKLPAKERQHAFTPEPEVPVATSILFDAWAATTIREELPGRPPVADWLHGVSDREQPETYVGWREEVEQLSPEQFDHIDLRDLLDDYPLKPHELLRDRTDRVFAHLEKLAERSPNLFAWVIEAGGKVRPLLLASLVEKDKQNKPRVDLNGHTVLLAPAAGGLEEGGTLNGAVVFVEEDRSRFDVADEWYEDEAQEQPRRRRVKNDTRPTGMRLVRTIELGASGEESESEEEQEQKVWRWYVRPRSMDEDIGSSGLDPCGLQEHLDRTAAAELRIVQKLNLPDPIRQAVVFAAKWHDLGKRRLVWQRAIGNNRYESEDLRTALAKSGTNRPPEELNGYRHELGSLLDLLDEEMEYRKELDRLTEDQQELVLHLIAAHHGRARPHFRQGEAFDPERPATEAERVAQEAPRRFARLQRKYGRWGLAYLESLVRAADILASQPLKEQKS